MAGRKPDGGYKVLVGINYGIDDKRAEPGDIVTDLPNKSVTWMLDQGIIEPAGKTPAPKGTPADADPAPADDVSKAGE